MDTLLIDVAGHRLQAVAAVLDLVRAEAETLLALTAWECETARRFRVSVELWRGEVAACAGAVRLLRDDLQAARSRAVLAEAAP